MRTISFQNSKQYIHDNTFLTVLVLIVAASGFVIALLPEEQVLMIVVLILGLPIAVLVVIKATRNKAVVLMLVLLPLTGILKAVTGSRFAPLTFDLALLFACLLHIGEGLAIGKLRFGKPDILLFLLWGFAFLEIFNPNVPGLQAGIEGFRKFIFMSVAFYIGRHLLQIKTFHLFRKGMLLFSVPVTLYGIKQFFIMWPIDYRMIDLSTSSSVTFLMGGWIRPFSTMSGPFHLGLYLVISLLLILSLMGSRRLRLTNRFLLIVLFILQFILLLMTRTKGNWVGFAVGVCILIVLQSRSHVRSVLKLGILALFTSSLLFALLSFSSGRSFVVLEDAIFAITHPLEAPTFIFRLELWQDEIIPAIQANPLIGYGTSSAGEGLNNLYRGTESQFFTSHNLYIKVLIELGLIGLLLFFLIIFNSLCRGLTQLRKYNHFELDTKRLLQWSISVVVAFLISGLVIPNLDAYPPNYYFWLLLGLLSRANWKEQVEASRNTFS